MLTCLNGAVTGANKSAIKCLIMPNQKLAEKQHNYYKI